MERIVLFDGVCNFCDSAINFVIRNDRDGKFKFTPLQSVVGVELRAKHKIPDDVDSMILIEDGQAYVKSDAALRIARGLGGFWAIFYAFSIIPRPIRDWAYGIIARNRYSLFGKKDVCMMPTPEVRSRFISDPPVTGK